MPTVKKAKAVKLWKGTRWMVAVEGRSEPMGESRAHRTKAACLERISRMWFPADKRAVKVKIQVVK